MARSKPRPKPRGRVELATASLEPGTRYYCALPKVPEPVFSPDVAPNRVSAILVTKYKWVNSTVLHYYFFDQEADGDFVYFADGAREWRTWVGAAVQQEVVRRAFGLWTGLGIGLKCVEVKSREDAEVRVGFMQGDGSWSYVGTYVLEIGASKRTMNFGWNLTRGQDGLDTAIHEIGHTLGLPHEHQNPYAGIVWDEEAVYTALAKAPNRWDRDKTYQNIIRKIEPDTVQGSNWDPDSVMHYPFEPGLIKQPEQYAQGLFPRGGLSDRDRAWVRTFYPATDDAQLPELIPSRSEPLAVRDGEQRDFVIRPEATRYYNVRTFGTCDTVIVLFADENGDLKYQTADDDSGEDRNASLRVKLTKGRRYVLRVRLKYSDLATPPAVMMW